MTVTQFDTLETAQAEAVLRWRLEVLTRAGFDPGNAMILASHVEVDLHAATDLVRRGCPPETAMQIVL